MNLFKFLRSDYGEEFTTLPRRFETYRWYKPFAVFLLAVVIYFGLNAILMEAVFWLYPQFSFFDAETLTYSIDGLIGLFTVALMAPALYIPVRLIYRENISAVGGWRWGIFFKTALVALIISGLASAIPILIDGTPVMNHFTVLTFILCLIITPFQCFAEEYVYRAFFMQTFGSWFRIPFLAIILQTILFTVSHGYNMIGLVDIFVFGIVMGLISWHTKGIEVSSAIHSMNNLVVFMAIGLGLQEYSMEVGIWDTVAGISLTIICVVAILLIERKWKWFGFKKESEG